MSHNYEDIFSPETMASLRGKSAQSLKQLLGGKDGRGAAMDMMRLVPQVMQIEEPYRDELEMIAIQMAKDVYPIIDYAGIKIDAKILESTDDIDDTLDEEFSAEQKRRIVNGITQGAALRGTYSFLLFREYIDDLDPSLVQKYKDLMNATFGGYDDDNSVAFMLSRIQQGMKMGGGSSKVIMRESLNELGINKITPSKVLDKCIEIAEKGVRTIKILQNEFGFNPNNNPNANVKEWLSKLNQSKLNQIYIYFNKFEIPISESQGSQITVVARAICFPMLLHEVVKGLYEILSQNAFKEDEDKEFQKNVYNNVDKLENEPHDLQYGKFIYDSINTLYNESDYDDPRVRELLFIEVYKLHDNEFLSFIENAINNKLSSSQKRWAQNVMKDIDKDLKMDDTGLDGLDERIIKKLKKCLIV